MRRVPILRAALGDQLEDVELREEDMGGVGQHCLVGMREILEEGQQGFEDDGDGGNANLDEGGARDGDDIVLVEILGRIACTMGELVGKGL